MTKRFVCGKLVDEIFAAGFAGKEILCAYKMQFLDALEKNRGEYLSGEQLASSLGVSRNAVWKAIQKLEEAGHKIRAVPKRGYTLAPESDVLTVQSVSRFLDTDMPVYLQVQTEVTSTNTLLKAQAEQGAPEGTVLIAESQTAGKGRLGRHFTSPPGTGIYFSLLLRPHCTAEKSLFITTTAAVAVCEAIEQVTGLNPQIKWVNDVYLNEKKVCGILTEASVDFENGRYCMLRLHQVPPKQISTVPLQFRYHLPQPPNS